MTDHQPFVDLMLAQAQLARLLSPPNPSVGAVAVSATGQVLGVGHTQQRGGPHAEVMMLRDAVAHGHNLRGATVYVSLEPCSHQGHTGPCCEALIKAGVAKVVASIADPNPLVAGKGFERLRAAGVAVEVGAGAEQARELNLGFFSRMIRHRPWVRMKVAASLDGTTALGNGASQWITSEPARADGHAWRAQACAVLTGIGTVLADNPRMNVRLADTPRQPHLVLVDSRLEVPLDASLFVPGRRLFIYTAKADAGKQTALEALGAKVIELPGEDGKVDLKSMLADLAAREINEVHVEAGYKLNGSLLRDDLVDDLLVYLAPKLLGPGAEMASLAPLQALSQATPLSFRSIQAIGPDLRILARRVGHDQF